MQPVRLGVFLLIAYSLVAIDVGAKERFYVGAKAGANISTFHGADSDGSESTVGFTGGAVLRGSTSDFFGVQVEVLYSQKGAKTQQSDSSTEGELVANYDYIEVPILAVFSYPTGDVLTVSGVAGGAFAFNVRSRIKGTGFMGPTPTFELEDEFVRNLDFGAVIGVEGDLNVGRAIVTLDARYTHGLRTTDTSSSKLDLKNRGFSFLAGVMFYVGSD